MQLTSRSATLVVATEQLCGNFGLPTTAPSRISILTRRNEPELRGISGSSELNTPAMTADTVQASLSLKPQSMLSMLSRKSMVIAAFCGSISISTLSGMPSGSSGSNGSWRPVLTSLAFGILRMPWIIRCSE